MENRGILVVACFFFMLEISADVKVVVQNNTSYQFNVALEKSYSGTLSILHEQTANMVKPMQRRQIVSIEQKSVKIDKECTYAINLSHNDQSILAKVGLVPSTKKTATSYAITSPQHPIVCWHQDMQPHSSTLPFDQTSMIASCRKYLDTEKNTVIEYQLQEAPRKNATNDANKLSVLSWNLDMKPNNIAKNGQPQRASLITPFVQGHDVIVLSDLFDTNSLSIIYKNLLTHYPHVTVAPKKGTFNAYKQGVVIFSKWPITQTDYKPFKNLCSGTDCSLGKGVLYARINKLDTHYNVYGTALQDWPTNTAALVRTEQIKAVKEFIDQHTINPEEPVIIAGSLNINKYKSSFDKKDRNEYKEMMTVLRAQEGQHKGYKFTIDPKNNTLARTIDPKEYSDYVLYINNQKKPKQFLSEVCVFKSAKPWSEWSAIPQHDLSSRFAVSAMFEF